MLGAGELCVTFHNYNTQWEDKRLPQTANK